MSEMHEKITALYFMSWFIRSCIKMHITRQSINLHIGVNYSCNKLHATYEIVNTRKD
ncbi:hypothetical protein HMPREF9065_01629 [Aggregatibacter sp. oral taxon 458 str. W10330]|nr:hypothetical protein HMPREF9065_01629 [Aggregatibacter sp. oral taxon 458 str. W10330]